jgi:mono/diheme cytochrome c family protein
MKSAMPLVLLVLLATWGEPAQPTAAGLQEDTPPAEPTPKPAKAVVVPEAEKKRPNPVPPVPEAIESGRILFQSQCHMCHGKSGDGKGELVAALKLKVPDLTDPKRQSRRTDGEWFYIIRHGHGDMPAEKRLADQQMWEMIHYVRTLAPPAPPKP